MKTPAFACTLAIATLLAAGPAAVQAQGSGPDTASTGTVERPMTRREARGNSGWDPSKVYYNARDPEFFRGGLLPPQLRGGNYVVEDWVGHRLSRPPRGHQWVQVGSDYVLVAIATGLIVQLVLNSR